jgi:hypothetical protein
VSDDAIPSGDWRGFYTYGSPTDRHRMDLRLEFANGSIRGDGIDDIGTFTIRGGYDDSLTCHWTKTYATHAVFYQGPFDMGSIYGVWEIPPFSRGGFRIWPGKTSAEVAELMGVEIEEPISLER